MNKFNISVVYLQCFFSFRTSGMSGRNSAKRTRTACSWAGVIKVSQFATRLFFKDAQKCLLRRCSE